MIIHQTANASIKISFFFFSLKHFNNHTSTQGPKGGRTKRVKYEIVDPAGYYYTRAAGKTDVWGNRSNALNGYVTEVSVWSEDTLLSGKQVYVETSVFQLASQYRCLSSLLTARDVSQKTPQAARSDWRDGCIDPGFFFSVVSSVLWNWFQQFLRSRLFFVLKTKQIYGFAE